MKTPLHNRIVTAVIVILSISISGCYTIIRHPGVSEEPETGDFSSCQQCHEYYHHPGPYDAYYANPWWDYYTVPWWYSGAVVVEEEEASADGRLIFERRLRYHDYDGGGVGINPGMPGGAVSGSGVKTDLGDDSGSDTGTKEKTKKIYDDKNTKREKQPTQKKIKKREDTDGKKKSRDDRGKSR